jgi:hypothetical protein
MPIPGNTRGGGVHLPRRAVDQSGVSLAPNEEAGVCARREAMLLRFGSQMAEFSVNG